jgi:cbb3-type cytochrome c oxidase subunit III
MQFYRILGFSALLVTVVAITVYGMREDQRMQTAQADLRQEFVAGASASYIEYCAVCHGAQGEGIAANPPLDSAGLRESDYDTLYKTIARGRYGTTMAGWHIDEGGALDDYQIDELIALIRYGDWGEVRELAAQRGMIPAQTAAAELDEDTLQAIAALDPQGAQWAEGLQIYGQYCVACHGAQGEGSSLAVALNNEAIRSSEATELARIINEGVPGTSMPGWNATLDPAEVDALIEFLRHWNAVESAGLALTPPQPIQVDLADPQAMLALGGTLYASNCTACHASDGSGGIGIALNSQQFLSRHDDDWIREGITDGGRRPNSTMPAFGDRLSSVEIEALVQYIRAWEPDAPMVAGSRGGQGLGPAWQRATPQSDQGQGQGRGQGQGQGQSQRETLSYSGTVVSVSGNTLSFTSDAGETLAAKLGPMWYWREQGISLQTGDRIELEGFVGTDHLELNWITNLSSGERYQLREGRRPLWAGGQ